MVRRSMEPSYDQSFDIKLTEEHLGVTFLTVQLKQSRLFAVKGDFFQQFIFCHNICMYMFRPDAWKCDHWQQHVRPSQWPQAVGAGCHKVTSQRILKITFQNFSGVPRNRLRQFIFSIHQQEQKRQKKCTKLHWTHLLIFK